jgi:hypothetical protein
VRAVAEAARDGKLAVDLKSRGACGGDGNKVRSFASEVEGGGRLIVRC